MERMLHMRITWLGQAGLMFETDGKIIISDPYLSDSVEKIAPQNKRRVPVKEELLNVKPDVILLTHNHLDHTDPETLEHYLKEDSSSLVLAPRGAWEVARGFGGDNNYVQFNPGTVWTEGNIRFTAVKAEHSDPYAIGIIIEAEGKKYYITGDTLYNKNVSDALPEDIDYIFLPVNGVGCNMNMTDAAQLCKSVGAVAIPYHCGLFDNLDLNDFPFDKKIVPRFYENIAL